MHKKTIKGNTYYYTTLREKGKHKTVYLGTDKGVARLRENSLKLPQQPNFPKWFFLIILIFLCGLMFSLLKYNSSGSFFGRPYFGWVTGYVALNISNFTFDTYLMFFILVVTILTIIVVISTLLDYLRLRALKRVPVKIKNIVKPEKLKVPKPTKLSKVKVVPKKEGLIKKHSKLKIYLSNLFKKPEKVPVPEHKKEEAAVKASPLKAFLSKFRSRKHKVEFSEGLKIEPPLKIFEEKLPLYPKRLELKLPEEVAPKLEMLAPKKPLVTKAELVEEGQKLTEISEKFKPKVKHIKPLKKPLKKVYVSRCERELLKEQELLKKKLESLY